MVRGASRLRRSDATAAASMPNPATRASAEPNSARIQPRNESMVSASAVRKDAWTWLLPRSPSAPSAVLSSRKRSKLSAVAA